MNLRLEEHDLWSDLLDAMGAARRRGAFLSLAEAEAALAATPDERLSSAELAAILDCRPPRAVPLARNNGRNGHVRRLKGERLERREVFSADAAWLFSPTFPGACDGWEPQSDSAYVALDVGCCVAALGLTAIGFDSPATGDRSLRRASPSNAPRSRLRPYPATRPKAVLFDRAFAELFAAGAGV